MMRRTASPMLAGIFLCVAWVNAQAQVALPAKFPLPPNPIELTRVARPNVAFNAIGRKAGILGTEAGLFESWVFPIKLFHDARFSVQVEGQDAPVDFADNIERIIARPESTTLVASNQLFTIKATFFTPIDAAGSIILLDVETTRPLTITASFVPDLKPMWPAGLGGQSAGWRDDLKAFVISESRRKFNGLFGCPAASRGVATPAHQLASGALRFDIKVDPKVAQRAFYPVIIAGGMEGRQPVIDLYQRLAQTVTGQYQTTFDHYRKLREERMSIETPDAHFNGAFEWAKVAMDRGMIDNPDLGPGLIAGWGPSGNGARPGFGWFFGGDAAINSYAMTAYGDFDSLRDIFRFLAKYQRADGKIPHEVSQSAAMIRWFDEYPYAYYHAETSPFFIAALHNYYRQSGDRKLIEELWPKVKKAYEFCVANDSDNDGILENSKAGLGASELGSLLNDLHQDIYLAATNLEASRAMQELAQLMGDRGLAEKAAVKAQQANLSIKELYWDAKSGRYLYALTKSGKANTEITAWTSVPMMFGHFDPARAGDTLTTLSSSQISSDWGARMLSNQSPAYDPIAYNNGGVWPFLTGFVACAEYEYRRPHAGFAHLNQLVHLGLDHSLGSHPEILSGDYYRPLDESVPHQLFSTGMVITPFVRGLLGLRADASARLLRFSPQIPAGWDELQVRNFSVGSSRVSLRFQRNTPQHLMYELSKDDNDSMTVQFAPALPLFSRVTKLLIDGKPQKPISCKTKMSGSDCNLEVVLRRHTRIELFLTGGIEVDLPFTARAIGDRSGSLRILDITPTGPNRLSVKLEGRAGRNYLLRTRGSSIQDVKFGTRSAEENGWTAVEVVFPPSDNHDGYERRDIEIVLRDARKR